MKTPQLPPALAARLAPDQRSLRLLIARIKRDPDNRALWRRAQAVNDSMLRIEAEFNAERRTAA